MNRQIVREDLDRIVGANLPWRAFEGKTTLITGANGFLPAYMAETLLRLNENPSWKKTQVLALARSRERAEERFSAYQGRDDLQIVIQDVSAPWKIPCHVDFVIHAASQASPKYYGTDPVGTLSANVLGTHNALQFARDNGVESFLFFSSAEVYGQLDDSKQFTSEESFGPLNPTDVRSCYAESKRMGETMCVSWFHQYGVPAKIVRPFHTYGPGMKLDDGRVFADFVADIVHNRDIVMRSDGSAVRAFCYIADATAAFFAVLLKGEAGQAYNVGNDHCAVSIAELANTLVSLFPEKALKVIKHDPPDGQGYLTSRVSRSCPDISKTRALGWEPGTSIEEGFSRTVRSFQ